MLVRGASARLELHQRCTGLVPNTICIKPRRAFGSDARGMKKSKNYTFSPVALAAALLLAAAPPAQAQDSASQTIVITATRHALAMVDAPAAMTVITRAQIAERGADNVLEAIRGETGVAVFGRTIGGRKGVMLRGMDARHTLYLVDGMRIGASDGVIGHTDFQLDWVPVEEIERIEVVRGPLSALYGAEALGGVLHIVTRRPAEHWEGSALVEGSSADGGRGGHGYRLAARVSGPLGERLRAALSVAKTQRDAVTSSIDPRISALEAKDKEQLALRLQAQVAAGHTLELDLRAGDERREATSVERGGPRRLYLTTTEVERRHAGLAWQTDWGGATEWRSTLRAYGSRIGITNVRTNGVAALRPNTLDDRVLDGQASARATASQLVTAGFELRDEQLENLGLPGGQASADHRSLFVQDEIEFGRALSLTAGVRHDDHQRFGGQWSPRLYGVWRAAPQVVVKGGFSRGFKPPTLKQITPGYQEDEGPNTYFSDPTLEPETNNAWELGVAWDTVGAGVQAVLFDNRVDNLILPRLLSVTAGRGSYVFDNLDRARLRGVELAANTKLAFGFSIAASYQYLDARDGAGARIERRPRHSGSVGVDWTRGPWRAGVRVESSSGMLLPSGVAGPAPQPVPDSCRVSAQIAVDVTPALSVNFAVSNLGNEDLARKSPLYTWTDAPRTWRMTLRGQW
jgi:outer membrane receptor for ferrienterochelin and colicins